MVRIRCSAVVSILSLAVLLVLLSASSLSQVPGERKQLQFHVNQDEIDSGKVGIDWLFDRGKFLFTAQFNVLDGFGRPGATGNSVPTKRVIGSAPAMIRTSGPESNSCAGCHNQPGPGGAGDFVANVFVLAQLADPVVTSVDAEFSNERNTLGMNGSGAIEMLAREMSYDLLAIRNTAIRQAKQTGQVVTAQLVTKDVSFGSITAKPDGTVDSSGVEGVDTDLIIKPFHQKGVVNSVRVFTINAYNHHHGLEAVERFGKAQTGTDDFDGDGVPDELSVGDITAATIYQVALPIPVQMLPRSGADVAWVRRGEQLFSKIGCADCHRPALVLNNPVYSEPNPFNPPGNLRPQDVKRPFKFDLTKSGPGPRLERIAGGKGIVRAYTDLKRHRICDASDPFFANEKRIQGGVPLDTFLTRKLWDVGNSGPYGHRGDCTTIGEAIMHHAGEGKASRDKFMALSSDEQTQVVDFLKTLVVLP